VPVFGDALAESLVEIGETVSADAVFRIRADIGGIDASDRGVDTQTAGEFLAARGGMAGHAVAGPGQIAALFHLLGREDVLRLRRCCCDDQAKA